MYHTAQSVTRYPGLAQKASHSWPAPHPPPYQPLPCPQAPSQPSPPPVFPPFPGKGLSCQAGEHPAASMTSVGKERLRSHSGRGSPGLGSTWSCRALSGLWQPHCLMLPLGRGRGSGKDALKGEGQPPSNCLPWETGSQQRAAGLHRLGTNCFLITAAYWGVGTGASLVSVPPPLCPSQFEMEASAVRVAR